MSDQSVVEFEDQVDNASGARGEQREEARLAALRDLKLLDTAESESFDRITRTASRLLGAPIAAVSLTDSDRQWFKSYIGTGGRQCPRDKAPCSEVTRTVDSLVVPDLCEDPRFAGSPLTDAGVRFYAGAPLVTRDGYALGAMCVLDKVPRTLSEEQQSSLEDLAALVMAQIELEHDFGRVEPLSGLPNRNQFVDDLKDLEQAEPNAERIVMLVNLLGAEQLQEMATVMGPAYIDELVRAGSRIVKDTFAETGRLYHVDAASFALMLEEKSDGAWRDVMGRLMDRLSQPITCFGIPIPLSVVFGVSPFTLASASIGRDVLRTAISAASDARALELTYAVYSPDSDANNRRRLTLLTDFRQALTEPDQLWLVFQPRVEARTRRCTSAEALLRWQHPSLGYIPPGEFVPLIEQTALARPMTEWVLAAALRQVAAWRDAGLDLRVSINVSARNLEEPDFPQRLGAQLESHGLPARSIELEFTESALIRNADKVLSHLYEINDMGVDIAIDDFGTGYSNFNYLWKIPARAVKLDRAFMQAMDEQERDRRLARSMIAIAHDMDLQVVAEGVETEQTLDYLVACDCDEIQGYLTGRPMPAADLCRFVRSATQHPRETEHVAAD